jgi:hypothetical protein
VIRDYKAKQANKDKRDLRGLKAILVILDLLEKQVRTAQLLVQLARRAIRGLNTLGKELGVREYMPLMTALNTKGGDMFASK